MSKSAKDAINSYFSVLGSQLISIPLTLLYLSFVTRIMGPTLYGRFVLFLSSVQFFFCIFINWTKNATIRFGSEEFTKSNKINKIFYVQILILSLTILSTLIVVLIFQKKIAVFTGLAYNIHLYLIVFLIFYSIYDFITQLLQAMHRIFIYGLALLIRQCIVLALIILFFTLRKGLTPLILIYIEILSYASVALFVVLPLCNKGYFKPVTFSGNMFHNVIIYSWPIIIIYMLGYFAIWADALFIRAFLNFAAVGRYEVANGLIQHVSSLIMPLSIVAFPIAVSMKSIGREDLIFKYAQRIIPQISFFWSIFIILLLLCSKFIFKIIFSNQYIDSSRVFDVLLIGLSFQILSVMYTSILQSYDLNKKLLFIAIVAVAVNLMGDLVLIPRVGILGASISKAASLIICGLLYLFQTIKCVRIKGNSYRNSIFFLTFPLLLLGSFLLLEKSTGRFLLTSIAILLVYLSAKRINLFGEEDIKFIRELNMPNYLKVAIARIYKGLS